MKVLRKVVTIVLVFAMVTLPGCGQNKEIEGKVYGTYGLLNESDMKNPDIQYRLIIGNIVWACILVETIIFPIYFIGFSLYEPINTKGDTEKGVLN